MDVNHILDKKDDNKTRGLFKISPDKAYGYSYYALIIVMFLIDILFVFNFVN